MRMTKILRRAAVGIAAAFLVLLAAACEHEVNEEGPSLEKWAGTWNSLSSYLDEPKMNSVYETFAEKVSKETKRTIDASEVKELVERVFETETDFASFKVEGNTITFYSDRDGGGPKAASDYTFRRETSGETFHWYCFEGNGNYKYWIVDPPMNAPSQNFQYFFFSYDSAGFEKAIMKTVSAWPTALPEGTTVAQAVTYLTELMGQIPVFLTWGRTLVCLGDSLTAGYGAVEPKKEDRSKSYPAYLQERVNIPVINKGVSGAFSAGGLSQINSILENENPRILIIELGANDYLLGRFLGGVPVSKTHDNLQAIIDRANDGQRKIYLAKFYTQQVAEDLEVGNDLIKQYDDMFAALASENNVELIDDIWAGVWKIHMSDEHHPNAKGYEIMADNYFNAMEPYLTANGLAMK